MNTNPFIQKTGAIMLLLIIGTINTIRSQTQGALLFDSATQQGVQEAMYKNNITKIANNVVYTAGASLNASGDYDIIITKHNNANVELWTQVWSNASFNGLDMAADLTIDANGDVIVVGTTQLSLTDYDAVILKYNSSGTLLWSQTFAGSANGPDGFVTVLASGTDIYCGGSVLNNVLQQHNALAVKYNGSGTQVWSHQYNSSANLHDAHNRIALSGNNVVYYGGVQTLANPITWTMVRLELVGATGAQVSANLSNNVSSSFTKINDIDLDAQDNLYIAGYLDTPQGRDIKVVKLMSMAVSWTFTFNGADNLDDEAHCIDVNGSSLYVAGYTTSAATGKDAYVVRIPTAGPPTTWQKIIDEAGGDDHFTALNIDAAGQLYLAGSTFRVSNLDLTVCKINFQNGTTLAQNTYNNNYNGNDFANGVAIDEEGNVFVASQAEVTPNSYKYNLVKWAQKTLYMPVVAYSSSGGYVANVSQLRNPDGTANPSVLYYNQQSRVATYLDDTKLSYQLVQGADTSNADTTYRVDMRFTKGSTMQKVFAFDQRREYHNYYLAHMLHKGERTPVYNSVWKNNVYSNTDILYTNGPSGFKQYVIARAGAPTGDFEMTFDGQISLSIATNGNLIIATTIGQIEYAKPKAYSMNLTTGALTMHSWQPSYVISGNKVSFAGIGSWGGALVLELGEPQVSSSSQQIENVDWSTMFGSGGEDQFKDVVSNDDNDAFALGESTSTAISDQIGLVIMDHVANRDIILVKFNEGCVANFISYYGGNENDFARGIDLLTSTYDLHVVGVTQSDDLANIYEATMEDITLGGIQDGVYVKFSSEGNLTFHTYVGGDGIDQCTGIAVDWVANMPQSPFIYYVGQTDNGSGWAPLVTGPNSQNMPYSGGVDGFYFKRSGASESVTHSTFFGSSDDDWFSDVALFKSSPVIVGITNASEYSSVSGQLPNDGLFPKAHGPFWHSDFLSNGDFGATFNYFIVWFGDDGLAPNQFFDQFRWCTYFCPANDGSFYLSKGTIATDNEGQGINDKGDIFLSGQIPLPELDSDLTFPFMQQGWQQTTPGGGGADAFFIKFRLASDNSLLTRSTLFGSEGTEYGAGFAVDPNHNVFLCGQSNPNNTQVFSEWCTPPTNGDFPMCDHNGQLYTETNIVGLNSRAFVCAFRSDGEMLWSTQYGNGTSNAAHAMTASNDKVWMVGYSNQNWTFENYDPNSESDYFRNVNPGDGAQQEATIARFDIPLILSNEGRFTTTNAIFILYPNPNNGVFILSTDKQVLGVANQLTIFNVLGELVYRTSITQEKTLIELNELATGCYQVVLQGTGFASNLQWIKQ